jgi:cytochrome P450
MTEEGVTTSADDISERLRHYDSQRLTPNEAFSLYEQARDVCPAAFSEELDGYFLLLNYDDVKRVHGDAATFSNEPQIMRPIAERIRIPPLEYDAPLHRPWRALFTQALNRQTPGRIESALRADIAAIVDGLATRGECDLIADFAVPIPLRAGCHVLDLPPEKGPKFERLAAEFIAAFKDPARVEDAIRAVAGYGIAEVHARRAHPLGEDDYLTWLAHAELDGRPLTDEQIGMVVFAFLVAGQDTSVNSLGCLLYEILTRPEIRRQLIDQPELIPNAVDESLRLHPPFFGFYRRARSATTIAGTSIPEGASLQLCWAAANRDPKVFDEPDEFRLDRPAGRHLTFGFGVHACPGQPMARLSLRLALRELLARLPDIELLAPEEVNYRFVGGENASIEALPARFAPRAR